MIRTVEAIIDEGGSIRLLQPLEVSGPHRAFVTILDEEPPAGILEAALLSEQALAGEWTLPEEEVAWSYLQTDR